MNDPVFQHNAESDCASLQSISKVKRSCALPSRRYCSSVRAASRCSSIRPARRPWLLELVAGSGKFQRDRIPPLLRLPRRFPSVWDMIERGILKNKGE